MASFIMAGRGQAALFIILSTLLSLIMPPFGLFTGAAIALISLRINWQQGLLYSLLGSAVLATVVYLLKQDINGILVSLIGWAPIVFFASILAKTRSWQSTLQALLVVTIVGYLLFHAYQPDTTKFWQAFLEPFRPAFEEAYQLGDQTDEMMLYLSTWMTSVFAAFAALSIALALLLARHWQAMLYNPGGFGEEFRQLRIGRVPAIIMVACIGLVLLTNSQLVVGVLIIAIGLFMLQGVSLVHGVVNQLEMKPQWIVGFYILLFILFQIVIVLLAAFGIIDNFVDFRRKIANRSE